MLKDMNEPSSFGLEELKSFDWTNGNTTLETQNDVLNCPTNRLDDPPYRTSKTAHVFRK